MDYLTYSHFIHKLVSSYRMVCSWRDNNNPQLQPLLILLNIMKGPLNGLLNLLTFAFTSWLVSTGWSAVGGITTTPNFNLCLSYLK